MLHTRSYLIALLLVLVASPLRAQRIDIGQFLSSPTVSTTRTLGSLDHTWTVFTLPSTPNDPGSVRCYTRGEEVAAGADLYLIAYKPEIKKVNLLIPQGAILSPQMISRSGHPTPLTSDSLLSLTLLNLHTTGSLGDIYQFDLATEIEVSREDIGYAPVTPSTSASNLKRLSLAISQFTQDNNETFPSNMTSLEAVRKALEPYDNGELIFIQPSADKPYGVNGALRGKSFDEIAQPASTVLLYEMVADKIGRRWIAFVDGHVEQVDASRWGLLKKASKITNTDEKATAH